NRAHAERCVEHSVSRHQRRDLTNGRRAVANGIPPSLGRRRRGVSPARYSSFRTPPLDKVAGHLVQESAWRIVLWGAPGGPSDSSRNVEPSAGACDADVCEPAFLRQLVAASLGNRTLMRENAVFTSGEEDRVELQALRSVQRHQGDDADICLVWTRRDRVG